MSTHNICFCAEIRKLIWISPTIWSYEQVIHIINTDPVYQKNKEIELQRIGKTTSIQELFNAGGTVFHAKDIPHQSAY